MNLGSPSHRGTPHKLLSLIRENSLRHAHQGDREITAPGTSRAPPQPRKVPGKTPGAGSPLPVSPVFCLISRAASFRGAFAASSPPPGTRLRRSIANSQQCNPVSINHCRTASRAERGRSSSPSSVRHSVSHLRGIPQPALRRAFPVSIIPVFITPRPVPVSRLSSPAPPDSPAHRETGFLSWMSGTREPERTASLHGAGVLFPGDP